MGESGERKARDLHRIEVVMRDDSHHDVTPRVLDLLLERNKVRRFRRSSGWATVGIDPIRVSCPIDFCPLYYGPERRTRH